MSTKSTTSASAAPPSQAAESPRHLIGFALARVIVPLWVLIGAVFKLIERNPKLLPGPVRDVSISIAEFAGVPDVQFGTFLDQTLRFLIASEFALVAVMFFVPKLARTAAILTLSLFVLVLIGVLAAGGDDCGCFGAGGPPPWMMLLIDSLLLVGVILFPAGLRSIPRGAASIALALGAAVLGVAVAYGVPAKTISVDPTIADGTTSGNTTPPVDPVEPRNGTASATNATPPKSTGWPAAPAPETTYFVKFESWIGTPLASQPLALQITRPLPADIDLGAWFVVFYRGDCDHCHELLEMHLSSPDRAPRTIAVRVPDTDPASDMPMPSDEFKLHGLPLNSNYVFTTPVMLTVVDGVVTALATDPGDEAMMKKALEAAATAAPVAETSGTAPASEKVPSTDSPTAPPAAPPAAPPSAPAAAATWPAPPAPEQTYYTDFKNWKGARLDAQPLARQITPTPPNLNVGRWHVLFYRADCDHCHALMEQYLVGDLEPRVVAVRVPDTDPAGDLPMPLVNAVMRGLPQNANYVIQTPILLTVVDGVIVGVALDSENPEEVMGCLDAVSP